MQVSPITSRKLARLIEQLPLEDRLEYIKYISKGGDRELWLLNYEKRLRGLRLKKEGINE